MPEFKSDQWHEVCDAINIVQFNFHRFVARAAPIAGSREIRSHVEAIEDELRCLFQEVRDRMDAARCKEMTDV